MDIASGMDVEIVDCKAFEIDRTIGEEDKPEKGAGRKGSCGQHYARYFPAISCPTPATAGVVIPVESTCVVTKFCPESTTVGRVFYM